MDRREFLRNTGLLAALIGVQVTTLACGDDDNTPNGNGDGGGDEEVGSATGSGHSHTGVITRAELDAGDAVTVTFTGSGHTHSLALTSDEVQSIAAGTRVEKADVTTPGADHPHTFVFN